MLSPKKSTAGAAPARSSSPDSEVPPAAGLDVVAGVGGPPHPKQKTRVAARSDEVGAVAGPRDKRGRCSYVSAKGFVATINWSAAIPNASAPGFHLANTSHSDRDPAALRVENLSRLYRSGGRTLRVLDDVSFTLNDGDTCSVLGPSGSGKTTLLGLCAALDTPSSGRVVLCGYYTSQLDEDGRSRVRSEYVGFVFQTFRLIPTLTALENVMVPAELRRRRNASAAASEALERVGLSDRLGHYPVQLSGGEQQRVGLARAFINEPRILFADEPTGNLDDETSASIQHLLFELNRTNGTTLVVVTHDEGLALQTDRIIRLRNGGVVSDTRRDADGFSTRKSAKEVGA